MSGINKLTDRQIKNLKPGARRIKIGDGDKLWLFVSPSGIKVWRMLWKEGNTQKQFTIGPYPTISLKEAREKRDAVNGLLVQGLDPNEQYRSEQEQQDEETNLTFRVVAQEWYEKRTVTQTESTRRLKMQRLERHVFPSFGDLPIKQLKPRDIILALHAIESQGRREMARRVGQIIGQICRYARVVGYLEYDISSGITEALEPKGPVQHRATITDPKKIGYLLRDIDDYPGSIVTKYALKILPYVFVRSQELRRARWADIDFQKHLWVIPPESVFGNSFINNETFQQYACHGYLS
ncbi:integrase arm-type DNA-binding domain-containing protein, partial [uncultured Desulfovibrio sp.]|uniref:tyrosine-type recombinase/integrase n=1 Tax=uncultured Desulfovibrio sp. TaxID=167968 RepID=UPI00262ACCBF